MPVQNVRVTNNSVMSESLPALPFFIPSEQKVQRPGPVPFPMDGAAAAIVTSHAHQSVSEDIIFTPVAPIFAKAHNGIVPITDPVIFPKDHVMSPEDSIAANPAAPADAITVVPSAPAVIKADDNFWSFGPVPMPLDKAANVPTIDTQYKSMLSDAFPTVSPDHPALTTAKSDTAEVKLYDQTGDVTLIMPEISTVEAQADNNMVSAHVNDVFTLSIGPEGTIVCGDVSNPVQEAIDAFVIKGDTNEGKGFYGLEPVIPSPVLTPSYFTDIASGHDLPNVTHETM